MFFRRIHQWIHGLDSHRILSVDQIRSRSDWICSRIHSSGNEQAFTRSTYDITRSYGWNGDDHWSTSGRHRTIIGYSVERQ